MPDSSETGSDLPLDLELPRGMGGFLERRRYEGQCAQLQRTLRSHIDERLEALEAELEENPQNFALQREMGELAMLDGSWERANAHLSHAHQLDSKDFSTTLNYAIVLAQRGQWQPAMDLLKNAHEQWPNTPLVLFNLALIALQAQRPEVVLDNIALLEKLWQDNPAIADDFHDEALTARGLALLLQGKNREAQIALQAAASHTVASHVAAHGSGHDADDSIAQEESDATTAAAPAAPSAAAEIRFIKAPEDPNQPPDDEAPDAVKNEAALVLEGKDANADLLNNLALCEVARGDSERAVQRLRAALHLEPGHARVHNNLGVLAYRHGHFDIALKYLDIARQIEEFTESNEPVTQSNMAVVLSARGELEQALELFQRAGQSERAEFEVLYNLGRAYIEHGKPDKGVDYLRRAFALNPQHPDVHTVLGAAYLLRGQKNLLAEALKHLKRALQLNSHHRIAFADLAMTMMDLENEEAAKKVLLQALKAHPKSPEALFLAALITMDEGDQVHWAEAAAEFHRTLDTRPDLVAALYNAALCQYLMGFRDAAAEQLQRVVQQDPSFGPAYYLIGVGFAVVKKYNEALTAWLQALKFEPNNADLHANMGFIFYQRQAWEKAINCYMAAHRMMPEDADLLAALGLCLARNNMHPQAIAVFQQSLTLKPNAPITHSNLGLAYYINKQVEKAIEHWRIVSQLDAGYASRRGEEQQRSFDDSIVALRPLDWRTRTVNLAPSLPRPHTRLQPGYSAQDYRYALSDATLQKLDRQRRELESMNRTLAWMNVHLK